MAVLPYSYAWAKTHGVALNALQNIEDYLYPYTKPRRIVPRSEAFDPFPIRELALSGRERGDGMVDVEWFLVIPDLAVDRILDDIFAGETETSAAMTINTRRHQQRNYVRGNCYCTLPSRKKGTLEYVRQGVMRVTLQFTNFEAL